MSKKHVYRVGDRVRIVEPLFVLRVGYPLTWPMLRDEFQPGINSLVDAAMKSLGIDQKGAADFRDGICRAVTRTRRFGGKERQIHIHTNEDARGKMVEVISKRVVKTGTYSPPRMGRGDYYREPEYEPGYLDDVKAHVLLLTCYGEIEECHVEQLLSKSVVCSLP